MLAQAAEADAHEDERHGESRGDELPAELADRERRLTRLKAAKAKLERELHDEQGAHRARLEQRARREAKLPEGGRLPGAKPAPAPAAVPAQAKVNLTDPESRAMKSGFRYFQGYNAQAAVAEAQIIVAAELTDETTDHHQLEPMSIRPTRRCARSRIPTRSACWLRTPATGPTAKSARRSSRGDACSSIPGPVSPARRSASRAQSSCARQLPPGCAG
jgi:hypothetical protein